MRFTQVCAVAAALAMPAVAGEQEQRRPEDWPDRQPNRTMAGPQLGLVFEKETGQLRRVLGLPGAAALGPAIDTGVTLIEAAVSPRQDSALGVTTEGEVVRITAGSPARPVDAPPAPRRIAFSPAGTMAALVYNGTIHVLRASTGALVRTVDLGGLDGPPGPVAAADDGTVLVATETGSVVLFDWDGARLAGAVRHAAAAAFFPGSRNALVADDADDQVFLLRDGSFNTIAGSGLGVAGPVAVETAGDGRLAVIANGRTGTILTVDLADGKAETVDCRCRPEGLRRTSQPGAYWLGERLVFEDGPSGRRVVFVAPAEGAQQ